MIRAAAEGVDADPLIDLSQIDFDALAARVRRPQAGRDRAARSTAARRERSRRARRNPTRYELVERIEELIAEYNAGSLNIDEYLRRLIALSQDLTDEEQRAAAEDSDRGGAGGLRPAHQARSRARPTSEREQVRGVAKQLLAHIHEKLVLDWRRKAETLADVRVVIRDILDELPDEPVSAAGLRREGAGRLRPRLDRLRRRRHAAPTTKRTARRSRRRARRRRACRSTSDHRGGRRADPARRRLRGARRDASSAARRATLRADRSTS